jgi:hypothetical protein
MSEREQDMIRELVVAIGALHFALSGVMAVLNAEVPDFKDRAITFIQQLSGNDPDAQRMIDEAVRMIAATS